MKTIKLTVLFLFFPLVFFAQTLTGLWTGTLTNDSTTIRRDQSFEIVLTQYKEKVYGYSRMTFFVHDTLYYIVKRVKGTIEGEVCEVKDDDIISHNFPRKPEKGVKLVSTFRRNKQDSLWYLDGDWKTTESKRYYSISGRISLKPETDLAKSKLMPHLEELKLTDDIAVYQESKKVAEQVVAIKQPVKDKPHEQTLKEEKSATMPMPAKETKTAAIVQTKQPEVKDKPAIADNKENKKDNAAIVQTQTVPVAEIKQPEKKDQKEKIIKEEKAAVMPAKETKTEAIVQTKQPEIINKPVITSAVDTKKDNIAVVKPKADPATERKQPVKEEIKIPEKQQPTQALPVAITKPAEQKKEPIIETAKPEIKNKEVASVAANDKQQPVSVFSESKPAVTSTAAVSVSERKTTAPQIVNFRSDSLELALYDNGEIDGDTVSVLLNGEIILARQGLKASAIKKMIYVPAGKDDSLTLVLYAENLGKYPPNTGLLVIHDGDDTYQVRFSADLQQNAAVIFKRKKN